MVIFLQVEEINKNSESKILFQKWDAAYWFYFEFVILSILTVEYTQVSQLA